MREEPDSKNKEKTYSPLVPIAIYIVSIPFCLAYIGACKVNRYVGFLLPIPNKWKVRMLESELREHRAVSGIFPDTEKGDDKRYIKRLRQEWGMSDRLLKLCAAVNDEEGFRGEFGINRALSDYLAEIN
jgi:hypothetical protein